jgi:hypothetical protein
MNAFTQLGIPGTESAWPGTPRASTLQKTVTTADGILTNLARANGHNVLWWWGIRRKPRRMCAYCYVCDTIITLGAFNVGISDEQSAEIDAHRSKHWEEVSRARTTEAGQA